jgi:hypothetical protein
MARPKEPWNIRPAKKGASVTASLKAEVEMKSVVDADQDVALLIERLRLRLNARLVAELPGSPVNPDDHGMVFPIAW